LVREKGVKGGLVRGRGEHVRWGRERKGFFFGKRQLRRRRKKQRRGVKKIWTRGVKKRGNSILLEKIEKVQKKNDRQATYAQEQERGYSCQAKTRDRGALKNVEKGR